MQCALSGDTPASCVLTPQLTAVSFTEGVTDGAARSDKQLAAADAAGNFDALRTSFKITGEANFISLRRAMQEYGVKWVDVLKIDIDGA